MLASQSAAVRAQREFTLQSPGAAAPAAGHSHGEAPPTSRELEGGGGGAGGRSGISLSSGLKTTSALPIRSFPCALPFSLVTSPPFSFLTYSFPFTFSFLSFFNPVPPFLPPRHLSVLPFLPMCPSSLLCHLLFPSPFSPILPSFLH